MSRRGRTHRRSLAPRVDFLEGRALLSWLGHPIEAPAISSAVAADRAEDFVSPDAPATLARSASPISVSPARDDATNVKPPRLQSGPDATAAPETDSSEPYDDASSDVPTGGLAVISETPIIADADPAGSDPSDDPEGNRHGDAVRSFDASLSFTIGLIALPSSATNERRPSMSAAEGETSAETASKTTPRPAPTAESAEPETEAEVQPAIEALRGAGLISRVLPFAGDMLPQALDEALDQFEDLGVFEALDSIAARRIVEIGAASAATLGAIELARRLHQRDFERNARRAPLATMVPGLSPTRTS
jgi:hypothetical protein